MVILKKVSGSTPNKHYFAYDPLASRMISKGLTDTTQINAIDYLSKELRANDLLSDFIAIYPVIGGTADSHKWNLLNDNYTLSYTGTVTHSANGMQGDGLTGYADTGFIETDSLYDYHGYSVYIKTNSQPSGTLREFGCANTANTSQVIIQLRASLSNNYTLRNDSVTAFFITNNTDSSGLFTNNRTSATNVNGWRNGLKVITDTTVNQVAKIDRSCYLLAFNNIDTNRFYSDRIVNFFAIHKGLSDAKLLILYNIVQQYQTLLSRNV